MAKDFPVDPNMAQKFVAAAVAPKMEYEDGERTNRQAVDRTTGAPLWRVSAFVMDTDSQRAPETVSVTVPAAVAPALPVLQPVSFIGLRVMMWSGGASLRADSVQPASSDTSASSAFLSDIDVAGGE